MQLNTVQRPNAEEALLLHKGRSRREGLKVAAPFVAFGLICGLTLLWLSRSPMERALSALVVIIPLLAATWILRFFRDFQARPDASLNAILSPAHGVVDFIEPAEEPHIMSGPCTRISIYLSLKDVHVQNAPMNGVVTMCKHFPGKLSLAIAKDAGMRNEHLLVGFLDSERPERKVALRLIAGIWVRRIVPWIEVGDAVCRSQRMSLIRFGSRTDVFIPSGAKCLVTLGQRVVGGDTPVAEFVDAPLT